MYGKIGPDTSSIQQTVQVFAEFCRIYTPFQVSEMFMKCICIHKIKLFQNIKKKKIEINLIVLFYLFLKGLEGHMHENHHAGASLGHVTLQHC